MERRAVVQEKNIKSLVARKYKGFPWVEVESFVGEAGIPADEVNAICDKYSLWQLAKNKGIDLLDHPWAAAAEHAA